MSAVITHVLVMSVVSAISFVFAMIGFARLGLRGVTVLENALMAIHVIVLHTELNVTLIVAKVLWEN